mmetsp:Transcript_8614/g.9818  ORF Transcript_8614/g.9818 Transcript_8614/m.9818 type:complete len:86 (+) Transcript_8614:590-847(+)
MDSARGSTFWKKLTADLRLTKQYPALDIKSAGFLYFLIYSILLQRYFTRALRTTKRKAGKKSSAPEPSRDNPSTLNMMEQARTIQ